MYPNSFNKLNERQDNGSLRTLKNESFDIDFYSNDYLSLADKIKFSEKNTGSTGSRLISGNSIQAITCENTLANFYQSEKALIFNSGYDANIGIMSSIATRHDTIIYDQLIHASLLDGIRLSFAKKIAFNHNDIHDLEKKIKQTKGNIFIVVEALYSMDGDFCELTEIVKLAKKSNAFIILDEAHSGGIIGNKGKGLAFDLGLEADIFARIFTFGKAYGFHGAVILGSERLIDYLINFARSFIYTTALPKYDYEIIEHQITNEHIPTEQQKLNNIINYFGEKAKNKKLLYNKNSPIQIIPNTFQLKEIINKCKAHKIAVKLILPPTVPLNQERIRICLHSYNTKEEIDLLFSFIT